MDQPDLESQFILRLPQEPANVLREAIRNNATMRDRFSVKIEDDMRHGEVRIDHWLLPAKVVDLPTVVESLKTIDTKGFYKTADICQLLLCRYEEDAANEEESPQKAKKKDSIKVDKKYLWPHGITAPVKNSRKRRFRKTLKKKYVEAPEIEKEVKRLLRIDNDAISIKWSVMDVDDENKVNKGTVVKSEQPENISSIAEHDIFGEAVSDSDEEDATLHVLDVDDNSQNSDSRMTDSNSAMNNSMDNKLMTEFSNEMFQSHNSSNMMQDMDFYNSSSVPFSSMDLTKTNIENRLEEIHKELADLKARRQQQEAEIENIENHALRQRFQDILITLYQEQLEKEREQQDLQELLKQI